MKVDLGEWELDDLCNLKSLIQNLTYQTDCTSKSYKLYCRLRDELNANIDWGKVEAERWNG